jgi:2-aminoadipate transaminase
MDARVVELQKLAAARPDVLGLAGGLPADELLPREDLARALADVTRSRDDALQYGWPEGVDALRGWITRRLAMRGATIDPERVIITAGAQQALALAAASLRGRIAVGDATYSAAIDAFRRAGARVTDEDGETRYVIAGVSNPHGVPRPPPDLTRTMIVDEAYVELRFDGHVAQPILADAPERVWHVGTISKTVAPGLRVGWLVPPTAQHAAALDRKHAADLQTASLTQAALARLLATIDYDALVERARRSYAERAGALVDGLRRHAPGLSFREPEGAFSIWVETEDGGDELALIRAALAEGVMFDPGGGFRPTPGGRVAFRVSYSNVAADRLDEAARRVARAVARWRRSALDGT